MNDSDLSTQRSDERGGAVEFGSFRFDLDDGLLAGIDGEIALPPKAAGVLAHLLRHPGKVISKEALLDEVWGEGTLVADRSLSEAIGIARQALGDDPQSPAFIQTVHRRGYRFIAEVTASPPAVPGPEARTADAAESRESPAPVEEPRPVRGLSQALAAAVVLAAVALAGWFLLRPEQPTPSTQRVLMSLPPDLPIAPARPLPFRAAVTISADGRQIVYVSRGADGQSALYLKRTDQFAPSLLPGTEGAQGPFFSDDGEWVGFFAGEAPQRLLKVRMSGGVPVPLADLELGLGGTWRGDTIVYAPGHSMGLHRIGADGGDPHPVTTLDRARGEEEHVWPQLLPDGDTLLFVARSETELAVDATVQLLSLSTGDRRVLLQGSDFARYLEGGVLVFGRDGQLWAREFDPSTGELGPAEVRLLQEDPIGAQLSFATFAVSGSGTLVGAPRSSFLRPVWFGPEGDATPMPIDKACRIPDLSPDDGRVAFTCRTDDTTDIWVLDLARETLTRVTQTGSGIVAIWHPEGRSIAFGFRREDGQWAIGLAPADGLGEASTLLASEYPVYPQAWSPDGETLVYQEINARTGEDLWSWSESGGSRELVVAASNASGARISPNGRWLAYHSDENGGLWQIYLKPFPELGSRTQVSSTGGGWPTWSASGDRLLFMTAPMRAVMAVDMPKEGEDLGRPRELFELGRRFLGDRKGPVADITSDGRILTIEFGNRPPTQLHLILGWDLELRSLLAAAR